MRENLILKCLVLTALGVLFAIVLFVIGAVVGDRQSYRDQVLAEVAQGAAGEQTLLGPLLAAPDSARAAESSRRGPVLLPESLHVTTAVAVEVRHRGIYHAQVYRSTHRVVAVFHVPPDFAPNARASAHWIFGISDSRGLHQAPVVRVDGAPVTVESGSGVDWIPQGFSVDAGALRFGERRRVVVEAEIQLIGTGMLSIVPVGGVSRIEMQGNWPHPSFGGGFLPDARTVDPRGFRAAWELSRFATGIEGAIANWRSTNRQEYERTHPVDAGVRFIEPVDVYQQSERATKYGMLFVILTFMAFFMFEVLKGLRVHPIQYGLVASALALFFLLLLSLSEQIPFVAAYLVASGACVALLGYYVASVLGSPARGVAFGALLAVLYALLYVILESKDYALLLGTLLLFGAIATILVATRRVDWYKVTDSTTP